MFRRSSAITFAISGFALLATSASAQQLTGCLSRNGDLSKVAFGGSPVSDCRTNETVVSWNLQGPPGPQGPEGQRGPQGPEGPEGPAGPAGDPAFELYFSTSVGAGDDVGDGQAECKLLGGRHATSLDVLTLPINNVQSFTSVAWVRPYIVATFQDTTSGDAWAIDVSGRRINLDGQGGDCRLAAPWASNRFSESGLVWANGSVGMATCDNIYPVLCAVPPQ